MEVFRNISVSIAVSAYPCDCECNLKYGVQLFYFLLGLGFLNNELVNSWGFVVANIYNKKNTNESNAIQIMKLKRTET